MHAFAKARPRHVGWYGKIDSVVEDVLFREYKVQSVAAANDFWDGNQCESKDMFKQSFSASHKCEL